MPGKCRRKTLQTPDRLHSHGEELGSSRKEGRHPQPDVLSNKRRGERLAQIVILPPLRWSGITLKYSPAKFASRTQFKVWTFQSHKHLVGSATHFLETHIDIVRTVRKEVITLFRVNDALKTVNKIIIVMDEYATSLRSDVLQRVFLDGVSNSASLQTRVDLICGQVMLGVVRSQSRFRQTSRIHR